MNKQLTVLTSVVVLAVGLGVWLNYTPSQSVQVSSALFNDFKEHANDVHSVQIENAQGTLFNAQKLNDKWLVTFESGQPVYPVSRQKLSDFITTMMQVRTIEAKTSKAENFSRLGLQAVDKEDSLARLVSLKANGKTWHVLIGNSASVVEGSYVRLPQDSQSWRTDLNIALPTDQYAWLKQPILPYKVEQIQSISSVQGTQWQMFRDAVTGDVQLSVMPEGKKLEFEGVLQSFVSSLLDLDFERLHMPDAEELQQRQVLAVLDITTADDKVIQGVVSQLQDDHFIRFTSGDVSDYWLNWQYEISQFSAQQLIKTSEDFLTDIETDELNSDAIKQNEQTIEEGESPN